MRKSELIRALDAIPGDPDVLDAMDRLVTGIGLDEADAEGLTSQVIVLTVE